MPQPLTVDQARHAFDAVAARGEEIAFRWLAEGCECRAQLMIEHLQAMGLEPGRAWAVSVGRPLAVANPQNPRQSYKWNSHVAPTVSVDGMEHRALVIDPSLSSAGPLTIREWTEAMRTRSVEVSRVGLSEGAILSLLAARVLQGEDLDAVVFLLRLDEPPIPNRGGTGFLIGPDPAEEIGTYARQMMRRFLEKQDRKKPRPP